MHCVICICLTVDLRVLLHSESASLLLALVVYLYAKW